MTEERLNELGRRIDALDASAEAGTQQADRVRQRRVAGLRTREASARAALLAAAASIEENLLQLETRVTIAERAAAADLAEDMNRFLGAATEELRSWDVYLERLQVKIAMTAGIAREESECAIGELRRHRNKLDARVREAPSTSVEAWSDARERVQAARDELESRAAEVEATLAETSEG
ncbi:MAG: hypothetical protein JOY58_19045 [Solirubrobacterales bacterium]|nr:hypothetical protein [Solirubrobacterales bacterium]